MSPIGRRGVLKVAREKSPDVPIRLSHDNNTAEIYSTVRPPPVRSADAI
jgi:hypothetical protein